VTGNLTRTLVLLLSRLSLSLLLQLLWLLLLLLLPLLRASIVWEEEVDAADKLLAAVRVGMEWGHTGLRLRRSCMLNVVMLGWEVPA
jgi:hypothetical protein